MNCLKNSGLRVLLVDDSDLILSAYSRLLPAHNLSVVEIARNGREAVDAYVNSEEPIDLVLMDYDMPEMNGIEAARLILEHDPLANIFIMSADPTVQKDAILAGARVFLQKPFRFEEFLDKLDAYVERADEGEDCSARALAL